MQFDYTKTTIVKHLAGSHAYGTNIEGSDLDLRGIFVAPAEYIRTPFYTCNEVDVQDEEDTKLYEMTNFMKLYLDMNPNIVETLWVDPSDITQKTNVYDYLRSYNQELLSSKVAFTFSGYAISQLKRIKGHNKWINNPQPVEKPRQIDYVSLVHNFSGSKLFKINMEDIRTNHRLIHYGSDLYGVYEAAGYDTYDFNYTLNTNSDAQLDGFYTKEPTDVEKQAGIILGDDTFGIRRLPKFLVKFNRDSYKQAKEQHTNFWSWKSNRNEKRSELEEKYGYDCYASDTEFLTSSGWKLFDDVTSDDELATFNDTATIQFNKYSERFDSLYTGNMYHYTGEHYDCLVTANHQMVYRPYERNNKKPKHEHYIKAPAAELPNCFQFRTTIQPRTKVYKQPDEITTDQYGFNDMQYMAIMGWYLSDGTSYTSPSGNCTVSISQSKPGQLMTNAKKMITQGLPIRKHEVSTTVSGLIENRFDFRNDVSKKLVSECGHGSKNKRIPRYVFGLSKRLMEHLLMNMIYGDGSHRKLKDNTKTYIYHTSNIGLANDVHELAFHCGFITSVWGPYNEDTQYGNVTMYQIHINMDPERHKTMYSDNGVNNNVTKIPVTNYRTVCFTVPNHTLVTRRNGKISLHGNCKHAMHLVRLLRMAEEILTDGVVNVKRPDAKELLEIRNGAWSYEELLSYSESKDELIRSDLYKKTQLRKTPDIKLASKVLIEAQDLAWSTSSTTVGLCPPSGPGPVIF